jgi:outer membrane protein assembly factor BamD
MTAARFNVKRKAWIAAAERSQWVIEHYPQTLATWETTN